MQCHSGGFVALPSVVKVRHGGVYRLIVQELNGHQVEISHFNTDIHDNKASTLQSISNTMIKS